MTVPDKRLEKDLSVELIVISLFSKKLMLTALGILTI